MTLPIAGELNHRIEIKRWEDIPVGDADLESKYVTQCKCWAKVVPIGSLTYQGSVQTGNVVTHRIIVRRMIGKTDPKSLNLQHVIDCDGMRYIVRRIMDLDGKRLFTQIEAEETGVIDGTVSDT